MHAMMRAAILEAAWERVLHTDWDQVRMSDIARDVGVSRQTVHNEFGTKDQLAQAMFQRELEVYLSGILEATRSAPSVEAAVRTALTWVVETARGHQLLRRVIADARAGRPAQFLALMATDTDVIVRPVRQSLTQAYVERWGGDRSEVERLLDLVVRLGVTAMLLPSDRDDETMIEDMVRLVTARLNELAEADPRVPPGATALDGSATTPTIPDQRASSPSGSTTLDSRH